MTSLFELVLETFDARLVSDGHELALPCPLCGDHRDRLFINLTTFLWTCHNCNESGNLISFLERVMEKDPFEAYHLATKLQPKAARTKPREILITPEVKLPGLWLDDPDSMIQRGFWRYLFERGLDEETVRHYQMRFEVIGMYRGRVIIPIFHEGVVASFAARAIVWWEKPKVLYPYGTKVGEMLFGLDEIAGDTVILVEGIFDAIRLRGKSACTFGAHLSAGQRALLHQRGMKNILLMRDGDAAGRREAAKTARELKSDGFAVRIAGLPDGEDPASAGIASIQAGLDFAAEVKIESSKHNIRKQLAEGN